MGNEAEVVQPEEASFESLTLRIVSSNYGASIVGWFEEFPYYSVGSSVESVVSSLIVKSGLPLNGSPKEVVSDLLCKKRLGCTKINIIFENVADIA